MPNRFDIHPEAAKDYAFTFTGWFNSQWFPDDAIQEATVTAHPDGAAELTSFVVGNSVVVLVAAPSGDFELDCHIVTALGREETRTMYFHTLPERTE
jgi:hypothetical protein